MVTRWSLSSPGPRVKALLICLLIMHDATLIQSFDPHPPIIWRKSKNVLLVNGAQVVEVEAKVVSPCIVYDSIKTNITKELKDWCEQSFQQNIVRRIQEMDGHEARNKRGIGLGLVSTALTSIPGWASIGVGVVVVAGISAYSAISSRFSSTDDEVEDLQDKTIILQANQEMLKEFAEAARLDIQQLATTTHILIPKLIAFAAEITSRLTVRGEQLEDGIRSWKQGKVSDGLLRALNITMKCGARCPVELMEPMSWRREDKTLKLVILTPLLDMERQVVEADAFTLVQREGDDVCFSTYAGPTHLSVSRDGLKDRNSCSLTRVTSVTNTVMESTNRQTCYLDEKEIWKDKNCTANPHLDPQIKRLGLKNIILCFGQQIIIDDKPGIDCPTFPFILPVNQSFKVGSFVFTGSKVQIRASNDLPIDAQIMINSQFMTHMNGFRTSLRTSRVSLDWVTQVRQRLKEHPSFGWIVMSMTCVILFMLAVMVYLWLKKRTVHSHERQFIRSKKQMVCKDVEKGKGDPPEDLVNVQFAFKVNSKGGLSDSSPL